MTNDENKVDQIKSIFAHKNHEEIQQIVKSVVTKYCSDTCSESGKYVPAGKDDPSDINWDEERWFNIGDAFPDDRDWIPTSALLNILKDKNF